MNTFENTTKTLVAPEEAIENYIGEEFLEWLLESMTADVKSWPELQQIKTIQVKIEKIRKFILQRYLAGQAFWGGKEGDPGFLGFAIANLSESPDPLAESALGIVEQKREEELGSTAQKTHHDLWIKLLKGLEISTEEINRIEAKEPTRNYIAELSDIYSSGEWQTTMGAFLAHERTIPEEYAAIAAMIKQNTLVGADALEVFTWHGGVDMRYIINTSHMLEKVMVDPEGKQLVWDGVTAQLRARQELYAQLLKYLEG